MAHGSWLTAWRSGSAFSMGSAAGTLPRHPASGQCGRTLLPSGMPLHCSTSPAMAPCLPQSARTLPRHPTWECMRMLWISAAACICIRCWCLATAAASKCANRVETWRWSPARMGRSAGQRQLQASAAAVAALLAAAGRAGIAAWLRCGAHASSCHARSAANERLWAAGRPATRLGRLAALFAGAQRTQDAVDQRWLWEVRAARASRVADGELCGLGLCCHCCLIGRCHGCSASAEDSTLEQCRVHEARAPRWRQQGTNPCQLSLPSVCDLAFIILVSTLVVAGREEQQGPQAGNALPVL